MRNIGTFLKRWTENTLITLILTNPSALPQKVEPGEKRPRGRPRKWVWSNRWQLETRSKCPKPPRCLLQLYSPWRRLGFQWLINDGSFLSPQPQKKIVQEVPEEQVRKAKRFRALLVFSGCIWMHACSSFLCNLVCVRQRREVSFLWRKLHCRRSGSKRQHVQIENKSDKWKADSKINSAISFLSRILQMCLLHLVSVFAVTLLERNFYWISHEISFCVITSPFDLSLTPVMRICFVTTWTNTQSILPSTEVALQPPIKWRFDGVTSP